MACPSSLLGQHAVLLARPQRMGAPRKARSECARCAALGPAGARPDARRLWGALRPRGGRPRHAVALLGFGGNRLVLEARAAGGRLLRRALGVGRVWPARKESADQLRVRVDAAASPPMQPPRPPPSPPSPARQGGRRQVAKAGSYGRGNGADGPCCAVAAGGITPESPARRPNTKR